MTETRVRAARRKGELNFEAELQQFLYAFGDNKDPLPETLRVVDAIVTDFIIETCHTAANAAHVSGRSKVKVDDFKFAIRGDELASGRVRELLAMEKGLKDARKAFDNGEGRVGLERGGRKKKEEKAEPDVETGLGDLEAKEEVIGDMDEDGDLQ